MCLINRFRYGKTQTAQKLSNKFSLSTNFSAVTNYSLILLLKSILVNKYNYKIDFFNNSIKKFNKNAQCQLNFP